MSKQTAGAIFFGFLCVLALSYFVAILHLGNLVRIGINRIGPATLQAPV